MATVKLKYRPSTVSGKDGTLYFQIIHDRVVRQLATGYKIFDEEWNSAKAWQESHNRISVTSYLSFWTCLSKFSLLLIFYTMTIMANFTTIHSGTLTFLLCTFGLTISAVVGIQYCFSRKT